MTAPTFEDGAWYWVEKEGWIGDTPTIAPALYKAQSDAWYSFAFSGIPTREVKVLEPCRRTPAVPVPQSIEQMAVDRYKVVPSHSSMFYPCAVVAGDGQQQLYIGRAVECQNMARKFTGAFLDGAFVALAAAPQPPEADHIPDAGKMVAVPVQMPEPCGIFNYGKDDRKPTYHHGDTDKEWLNKVLDNGVTGGPHRSEYAYTEQQVIDLLKSVGVSVKI